MKTRKSITSLILLIALGLSNLSWSQDEMAGKLMMGYQGWFLAKGDNSGPNEWRHWFRSTTDPSPDKFTIDMWPDMAEYSKKYNTNMSYADGSNAQLFSSHDLSTTKTHFKWMKEHNVHGVHLQRFLSEVSDPRFFKARNNVLQNVITSSAEYDRKFSVMYDLSGVPDNGSLYNKLIADWEYLVDTYDILNQEGYVKEDSRPVVAIWGIGFKNRGLKVATFKKIIDYFHKDADPKYRAYVMGGVPDGWRNLSGSSETGAEWTEVYKSLDMISPWTVGRYSNESAANNWKNKFIVPDLKYCNDNDIDYMPVIWPGFSWLNLHEGRFNQIPRNEGKFYWRQAYNAIQAGVKYVYVAMFDEVDEATAMFKLTETKSQLPVEAKDILVPLDIDGKSLPSDWYLQLADQTQKMLDGSIPLTSTIPISPATAAGNASGFVSQQNVPLTMDKNETATVSITFKNNGTSTWTKASGYRLGSENPKDNIIFGTNRVDFLESDQIKPGEEKTFEFNITAPNIDGYQNFQWRILQDNVEWFGDFTSNVRINVGKSPEYLDDCDATSGWNTNGLSLNTADKVQGTASLEYNGSSTNEFAKSFDGVYKTNSNETNTILQFWYYVSDISVFKDENQVEISSAGKADVDEYSWALKNLVSGWNFIQLKVSEASKIGNPNLKAINWLRLYRFKTGSIKTRIDGIQLLDKTLSSDDVKKDVFVGVYPNPASTKAVVSFNFKTSSKVSISILNILGQVVSADVKNRILNSGKHNIEIPVHMLKKGTYILKMQLDHKIITRKLVIK